MKLKLIVVAAMVSLLAACGAPKTANDAARNTVDADVNLMLEFDTVFASTMSVFQDLGYTVTGADKQLD